jgi:hypothetical protein
MVDSIASAKEKRESTGASRTKIDSMTRRSAVGDPGCTILGLVAIYNETNPNIALPAG